MSFLPFDQQKPLDFIAVGRLCIDLNANEIHRPMEETMTFTKYVGGSPANIAIGMARLGMKTGFIGRVADDQMGRFIVRYLKNNGIDTSHVITDKSGSVTGLAFTEIKSPTDCSILMYRDNVADLKLEPNDIDEDYIRRAKCLLISGTALAKSPSREAVFLALDYARRHGTVVVFDLDYRPYTWQSKEETAIYYNLAAEKCDVIIGTREEFDMMERFDGQRRDDEQTARKWFDYNAKIVVIKHGKDGSIAYTKTGETFVGTIFPANIVKTFGAGDSYAAGFIYGLMNDWPIPKAMEYGAAAASIVISSHSCSDAMPTLAQIEQFIEQHRNGSAARK
ncbi:5-dehydro-2-deoxygluconokinase [Geobacillus thermoleovorans]|uniref:5-dehydro-2-deoxygluconokinase n=2 Tax=Geobacillus TaxID=129337 RepID=IOLC_GEOKA|nr:MULTISPECIES: 5-dehydro-2-deoxygluconokinase [Geobacillus]Q5KYR3.1 RecName: Full=5-dehydro-2-deoxygluconokinase; AltName: Full=2-deoxy-5-keto-D-gluconate kinase; Short=DKG kinase [Geobacillus kaustophilus HTA426]KZE96987.1 5-dehydro-2-deoxygluconokinase [Geobacillus stearothermophilus]AMQ20705.1 5-dehydro-2-deoxygluconokinase [Geobacillus sp. JS12]AMV11066.1 5-dehydro-2-deoxygluconokinase [Geobacillus thermoleovorans]KLR73199.1 5-dehydro-2-deoxygluconokinase [Geobacillus sp. T6]MED4971791.